MTQSTPRSATLAAGYDEEDPYADEDLSEYPDWWRQNIDMFRAHGLRPYRPPRFEDGVFVPPVVDRLEAALGIDARFQIYNPQENTGWNLVVDGEPVTEVTRTRTAEGYSQYHITSDEFEEIVRSAAAGLE